MAVIAGLDGFAGLSPLVEDQSCCQQLKVVSRFLASAKARSKHLQPVLNSFLCPGGSELLLISSQPSTLPSPSNDFATPSLLPRDAPRSGSVCVSRAALLDQVPYLNLLQLKNKMFWLKNL